MVDYDFWLEVEPKLNLGQMLKHLHVGSSILVIYLMANYAVAPKHDWSFRIMWLAYL